MMAPSIGVLVAITLAFSVGAGAETTLDNCLNGRNLLRVARVLDPAGEIVYARVVEQSQGHITRVAGIAPDGVALAEVFDRATEEVLGDEFDVADEQVCAVVDLPEEALDRESHVIVSTGLNYAAHAEEAGGGDVFLFPKPAAPTSPYASVHAPSGVSLLDYEVELAFVLLADVDPFNPPSPEALLASSAFFLSNDVSDREPIVRLASLSGPGTGFSEGKGQPGFFPAGPWMIRGTELAEALEECGSDGLGLRLWVDDEAEPRQDSSTALMILPPAELVAQIGSWIAEHGRRSSMTFTRPGGEERFYPLAVPEAQPLLPAGSIVQTGTPDGVAMAAPSPLGVTLRGLFHLRSPFEQFLVEEQERFAGGGTRYLAAGSVVRAQIDGLGAQRFLIGRSGDRAADHPCNSETLPD